MNGARLVQRAEQEPTGFSSRPPPGRANVRGKMSEASEDSPLYCDVVLVLHIAHSKEWAFFLAMASMDKDIYSIGETLDDVTSTPSHAALRRRRTGDTQAGRAVD